MKDKIIFIDRDGTLIEEPKDEQVDSIEKVKLLKNVIPSLLMLKNAGYKFIIVSNQDGLGTNKFPLKKFKEAHQYIIELFLSQGIKFDQEFFCPHKDNDNCKCRKPLTGLLNKFLANSNFDKKLSAVIGDRDTDIELATNLGIRGYKISDETNLTVSLSGDGNHYGLQYEKFIPILVKALQEADDKIDALETRIKTLEDA